MTRQIMFAHAGERRFEIQSAPPGHEWERVGEVVLAKRDNGTSVWHCRDQAGKSLLIQGGRANVFPDAWEAADWLVRYHYAELGQAEFETGQDLSGLIGAGVKA